jgi:hypothetical protein
MSLANWYGDRSDRQHQANVRELKGIVAFLPYSLAES